MNIPFFRTEYNYDRDAVSDATGTSNDEPSLTRQEFAADADINTIIERMKLGYAMPINTTPPQQGDFTNLPDFTAATKMIRHAQEVFNALPAKIRNRFENDPQKYIDFFHDEDNRLEAEKMGLLKPKAEEDNPPTPPAPEAPKAPNGAKTG